MPESGRCLMQYVACHCVNYGAVIEVEAYLEHCHTFRMGRFAKRMHAFFVSNTFKSNARLKSAKNHAKVKQQSEAELWLIENYSLSSSALSSKITGDSLKNVQQTSAFVLRLYD